MCLELRPVAIHCQSVTFAKHDAPCASLLPHAGPVTLLDNLDLEHGTVADDLNWWTTRLWSPFLCDLSASFPRRAFEHLREGELFLRQFEFGPYLVSNAVPK